MAGRKVSEILEKLKGYIGEDTSDETLEFLGDFTDTMAQLDEVERLRGEAERIETEWRKRYRERFFAPSETVENDVEIVDEPAEEPERLTYENLFKED